VLPAVTADGAELPGEADGAPVVRARETTKEKSRGTVDFSNNPAASKWWGDRI